MVTDDAVLEAISTFCGLQADSYHDFLEMGSSMGGGMVTPHVEREVV